MNCPQCGKAFEGRLPKCPHCGAATGAGMFQTSTVLISTGDTEGVYRSVDEVPAPLRSRLLKSTAGANSATILIADRKGREEIARAMREAPATRKFAQALLDQGDGAGWRLSLRGKLAAAGLLLTALIPVVWFVFVR